MRKKILLEHEWRHSATLYFTYFKQKACRGDGRKKLCNKRKHCDEIEGNACSKMEDIHHDTDNKLHCFHAGVYGAPLTVVNIQRRSEAAHIQVAKQ